MREAAACGNVFLCIPAEFLADDTSIQATAPPGATTWVAYCRGETRRRCALCSPSTSFPIEIPFTPSLFLTFSLLLSPRLQPYFNALCGTGYRLDHSPFILQQRVGADGFVLHGGAVDDAGRFDHVLAYDVRDGHPRCTLLAASLQLTDTAAGEGGFVILPGSHKSAFKVPPGLRASPGGAGVQPALAAGDVLLFSEAAAHGTLAWKGAATRRVALYRFSPATCGYGRGYVRPGSSVWPEAFREGMSPAELAVLEPPYASRLDRPAPAQDGVSTVVPEPRAEFKKAFDASVFGETYF